MTKQQLRAVERHEKSEDNQEQRAVTYLMASEDGRAWIYTLLNEWGAFRTPFDRGGDSETNFNCGTHAAALRVFEAITTYAPDQYLRMMQERKAKDERVRTNDDKRRERDDDNGLQRVQSDAGPTEYGNY